VAACLGLPELEFRPAPNYLAPELDKVIDQLDERQHLRLAADDRKHDDAEAALQLSVLVQIVEDDIGHLSAF